MHSKMFFLSNFLGYIILLVETFFKDFSLMEYDLLPASKVT